VVDKVKIMQLIANVLGGHVT